MLSKNGDDEGNQPHLIAIARPIERGRLLEAQETKSASLNREARRFHSSSIKIFCYIKLDDTYLFDESRRRILAGVRDLKYDDSLVIICLLPV